MDHRLSGADNYFATYDFADQWRKGEQLMRMRFWHRPLSAMTKSIRRAQADRAAEGGLRLE